MRERDAESCRTTITLEIEHDGTMLFEDIRPYLVSELKDLVFIERDRQPVATIKKVILVPYRKAA